MSTQRGDISKKGFSLIKVASLGPPYFGQSSVVLSTSTGTGMLIFGLLAALFVPGFMPNSKLAKDRGGAPWKPYMAVTPDLKPKHLKNNFHVPLHDLKLIHCGLANVETLESVSIVSHV